MDYTKEIIFFPLKNENLYVTEFGRSYSSKPVCAKLQVRTSYIIHFVTKGNVNSPYFNAQEGEAFLLSKNMLHTFSLDENFDHFWIGFNGEGAENLLNSLSIPTHKHVVLKITNMKFIEEFLTAQMVKLKETKCAKEALSTLLYCLPYMLKYPNLDSVEYVEMARNFIENNYQHDISMEMVAKSANISEKYLCKLFKKEYGISPQKYLIKTRMNMAKKLLLNTNMLIKEVAENVGFSSQFAFSTSYKQYYKITPKEQKDKKQTR